MRNRVDRVTRKAGKWPSILLNHPLDSAAKGKTIRRAASGAVTVNSQTSKAKTPRSKADLDYMQMRLTPYQSDTMLGVSQ